MGRSDKRKRRAEQRARAKIREEALRRQQAKQKQAIEDNSQETPQPNQASGTDWKQIIIALVLSAAWLYVSTIGGNMLSYISPKLGFTIFVLCLCLLFCFWTWKLTAKVERWHLFSSKKLRLASVFIVLFTIIFTSQFYIDYYPNPQGTIDIGAFHDNSVNISFHLGRRPYDQVAWDQKSLGELKQQPVSILNVNERDILSIQINDNKLSINADVFTGYGNDLATSSANYSIKFAIKVPSQIGKEGKLGFINLPHEGKISSLKQPVLIRENAIVDGLPNGWERKINNTTLEIINEKGLPVLIIEYKSPYEVIVAGLFATSAGIAKIDNNTITNGYAFIFRDSLSELGSYKIDSVFPHSLFDLMRSEKTYKLSDFDE